MDRDPSIDDSINRILDLKEQAEGILEELESEKTSLYNYMTDKDVKRYSCEDGKATCINFVKESLKTQETLMAIDEANKYKKYINKAELLNASAVGFVLVKGID